MIDNYLLEYLVLFAKTDKLTAVAQKMAVTPASVSRGLKKLEQQLGVELFEHGPQKLKLTKTGQYAAKEATKLLAKSRFFETEVKNYALKQKRLKIGSTLKGINELAKSALTPLPDVVVSSELLDIAEVKKVLLAQAYSLILTTRPVNDERLTASYLGKESLAIQVTANDPLFSKETVSFKELQGERFIVAKKLGLWGQIVEEQTQDVLLFPQDPEALRELTFHSEFAVFRTNISAFLETSPDPRRKLIFLTDQSAKLDLYAVYLKDEAQQLRPLLTHLKALLQKCGPKGVR